MTTTTLLAPTGPDVLGLVVANVLVNLRRRQPPTTVLPPVFRLARLVCGEVAPLRVAHAEEVT